MRPRRRNEEVIMSAIPLSMSVVEPTPPSSGGTLVSLDGRTLPLHATTISGRVRGGYGRIALEQRFVNAYAEPLRVTYQVPLPSDGAVAGFRFRIGEEEIVGEVDRKDRARERFEQAILDGHTAALLEQDRSSLFTQEVGNIPPGVEVVVTLEVDCKLRWLPDADAGRGGWELRFPTVVAPRYLGATARVHDGGRVAVEVADRPRPIAMSIALEIAEPLSEGGRVRSPSHALDVTSSGGVHRVSLADDRAGLDRDVVVRWPVVAASVGITLDTGRPASSHPGAAYGHGLLTLVPPSRVPTAIARDLVVLLDTSGSMHGEPLSQARHVTSALVQSLGDGDSLELIEFSNAPRRFSPRALPMTAANKALALKWIAGLSASGGTEMRTGILEALAGLRDEAQRQVVVITDGLIGFEEEVVGEIMRRLPEGSRVHTVGVGSAVNRSLTTPAARAGRGVEVIVGIGEDPERAAARVLAHTCAPIVVDVRLEGDALAETAPARLPDLFAGAPALVAARLLPQGGELVVRGRTADGPWSARVHVPAVQPGDGSPSLSALFAREKVEDLELRHAAGDRSVDEAIAALGIEYRIATRLTSWIAVSASAKVDPRDPSRRESIPQELPHGMSIEGLGLRGGASRQAYAATMPMQSIAAMPMAAPGIAPPPPAPETRSRAGIMSRLLGGSERAKAKKAEAAAPPSSSGARGRAAPPAPRRPAPPSEQQDEGGGGHEAEEAAALLELRGRVLARAGDRLVVEIVLPDALAWAPGESAELVMPDGTRISVAIDDAGTTRAAEIAAGASVRIAVRLDAGSALPLAIELHVGHDRLRITL
jgi:Ca-activated chloride channel family protein